MITSGKLDFQDLAQVALTALQSIIEGFGGLAGGPFAGLPGFFGSLFGSLAGRDQGGPVVSGRPYIVGERGRELFIPQQAGRIIPAGQSSTERTVTINITVNAPDGTARIGRRTADQVARAVRRSLSGQAVA